jgi:BirA family biotin operon repressor/biotin-[acetyl-CoA-carboxylase] ligase
MLFTSKFIFFNSIESTHDFAIQHASHFDPNHLICIQAAEQTKGKGQFDRPWLSPKGNLFITYVVKKPMQDIEKSANFIALCVYNALELKNCSVMFKEPNDLYIYGKKCAGFLCHIVDDRLIMSFGLNTQVAPADFGSVRLENAEIFHEIHQQVVSFVPAFIQTGFQTFEQEWKKVLRYH